MDLDGAGECAKLRTNVEAKAKAERKAALEEEAERRAEREAKDAAQRERERSTQMKLAKQQKVPLPPPRTNRTRRVPHPVLIGHH